MTQVTSELLGQSETYLACARANAIDAANLVNRALADLRRADDLLAQLRELTAGAG